MMPFKFNQFASNGGIGGGFKYNRHCCQVGRHRLSNNLDSFREVRSLEGYFAREVASLGTDDSSETIATSHNNSLTFL